MASNSGSGTVTACYFAGAVSGTGERIGAVLGSNYATVTACYWTNSSTDEGAATYGIGDSTVTAGIDVPASNENAIKVEDNVTWETAASTMNSALTDAGWKYVTNNDDNEPLTLEKTN